MNHQLKLRVVTIIAMLCYMFAFGVAAYEISYKKGKITNNNVTITILALINFRCKKRIKNTKLPKKVQ